jgi:hypothetical protein
MAGQDGGVQHVGVRHDQVGVSPDQRPLGLWGVTVVHGRPDLGQPQVPDLAELIPGQRLGGEQVQGSPLLVAERHVGEGQVVHQRLARGRPRGHHHVAAFAQQIEGPPLVRVQALDAQQLEA